jgi:hypothetical protein
MVCKIYLKTLETFRFSNILIQQSSNLTDIIIQNTETQVLLFFILENKKYILDSTIKYKGCMNQFNQIIFSNDNYLNLNGIFLNSTQIIKRSLNMIETFDYIESPDQESRLHEMLTKLNK